MSKSPATDEDKNGSIWTGHGVREENGWQTVMRSRALTNKESIQKVERHLNGKVREPIVHLEENGVGDGTPSGGRDATFGEETDQLLDEDISASQTSTAAGGGVSQASSKTDTLNGQPASLTAQFRAEQSARHHHVDSMDSYALETPRSVSIEDASQADPEQDPVSFATTSAEKVLQASPYESQIRKLSAAKIEELTSSPESLFLHPAPNSEHGYPRSSRLENGHCFTTPQSSVESPADFSSRSLGPKGDLRTPFTPTRHHTNKNNSTFSEPESERTNAESSNSLRPPSLFRAVSTPLRNDLKSSPKNSGSPGQVGRSVKSKRSVPSPLHLDLAPPLPSSGAAELRPVSPGRIASPMPPSIPIPPLSLPTYLQLELSSLRPSSLYIHRSAASEFPYESSKIKFERLLNFLLLPPQLELTLWFGALACLDSWLYSFTILPLRFCIALGVLGRWWGFTLLNETRELFRFVFLGLGRMWRRSGRVSTEATSTPTPSRSSRKSRSLRRTGSETNTQAGTKSAKFEADARPSPSSTYADTRRSRSYGYKHRRAKSTPSALLADHKADLLKGLVVLFSCLVLMRFDASRMYHGIRGQAAIKLYVIYNVLEVSRSNAVTRRSCFSNTLLNTCSGL